MDIKDSYLHGTVGVVKSISVDADKLKYTLADIAGTVREVTLPVATTSANGLMSSGDKTKLDNLSTTLGNYVTLNTDQEITGTKTFTKQLKFTVAAGTSPFTVASGTKVTNLNVDRLDDRHASDFAYCDVYPTESSNNWAILSGIYRTTFNSTGLPNNSNGHTLIHGNYDNNAATQLFLHYNADKIHFRRKQSNSWQEWKQIAFTDSDITGNAASADKVKNDLVLKINSGTTEGTDLYTYNGSSAKTLDIKWGTGIKFVNTEGSLQIYNSGVRSISTGTTNGTIRVNTDGTSTDVAVKGLDSAAYTKSDLYVQQGTINTITDVSDLYTKAKPYLGQTYVSVIKLKDDRDRWGHLLLKFQNPDKGLYDIDGGALFLMGGFVERWSISGKNTTENPLVLKKYKIYDESNCNRSDVTWTASSFIGNLDGTYVNALTGYSKATSAAALAATDTLNAALGKLEYKADTAYSWYRTITEDDTDDIINKWDEVVDFVNGLDVDLTDEFVTRKTDLIITGTKTFASHLTLSNGIDYKIVLNNTQAEESKILGISFQQDGVQYGALQTWGTDDILWNTNKIWHEGNDGSGSGLDADTLDGYHVNNTSSPWEKIPVVSSTGVIQIGRYIDFHSTVPSSGDYSTRLQSTGNNANIITLPIESGTLALTTSNITGNADTATKLKNPVKLWGNDFDGSTDVSGNITLPNGYTLLSKDSTGNARLMVALNSANEFHLGYGTAKPGYHTLIHGNNILFYGASDILGMILKSGKLGIGTSDPYSKLHVYNGQITIESKNDVDTRTPGNLNGPNLKLITRDIGYLQSGGEIQFYNASYIQAVIRTHYTLWITEGSKMFGSLCFYTKDITTETLKERMRIHHTGSIGVNVSNPQAQLHVNGSFLITSGDLRIRTQTPGSADPGDIVFENSEGSELMRIFKGTTADKCFLRFGSSAVEKELIHSGNLLENILKIDGHGSGIDADTLDGKHVNTSATGGTYGKIPYISDANGVMEIGRYIDFHSDNTTVLDFSTRIESEGNNGNVLKLPTTSGTLALTTDAASSITITLDTVSDATYPLIWTSARSTDTSSGKLYKSFSDLTYHPKLKTVSTTYFKGALLTCVPGARTNSLVYTSGAITIGSALGNAFEGSSPNYELLSYPKDSTVVNSGTSANIMNLRFIWGTSHWHDIFMSPNNPRLYHRYNINTTTGKSWTRIVEESSSEIWNIIADNSTKLGGISASKYVHRELLANNYSYDANTLNTDCVIYTSTGDLLGKAPTWNNFPRATLPQGGFSLFTIYEGGYGRQLFGEYNDPHLYVRCQSYDSTTGKSGWTKSWETIALLSDPAPSLKSTTIIKDKQFSLSNTLWIDVTDADNKIYTFTDLISGTYAVQITCGNLVASGIMSVCKNITDTALDEIPLHVYHDSSLPWRPYLRTSGNKLLISSNDAAATSRKVTIKIALIL